MYKISKEFSFSASHLLEGLPIDHPCSKMHGHNYVIKIFLKSDALNELGFVRDYRGLDFVKKYIDETLDHQHLNDVLTFNPTAENIAKFLYDTFKQSILELYAVEVSETPKTSAIYEADSE